MSESSLAARLAVERPQIPTATVTPSPDSSEYEAFSFGRVGRRAQPMIEFQKADGYRLVLAYVDLRSISTTDPNRGFSLEFADRTINVSGNELGRCYEYLRQNRVSQMRELPNLDRFTTNPIIDSLSINHRRRGS